MMVNYLLNIFFFVLIRNFDMLTVWLQINTDRLTESFVFR